MVYSPERKQLIEAVEQNDLKTVKLLVEKKRVPLSPAVAHIAAEKGYMKILLYVARKRPGVLENKDQDGNTVLHLGVGKGGIDLETFKFLVEKNAVPLIKTNDQRQTVVRLAAKNGYLDIVEYVAEKKPLILSKEDVTGRTILHMDDENKVMSLIEFLEQKYGDDIPHWHRYEFESAAVHASIQMGHWNVLKYFLEKKECEVDIINSVDETPVFTALKYGRQDMFRYLVEKRNASLTEVNEKNENILFVAASKNDLPTIEYVLDERKANIDVNWQDNAGNTLLHEAVIANQTGIMEYLVERKRADVNVAASGRMTPLHHAAFRNNYEVSKYLVEHGADARLEDADGFYPKSFAGDYRLDTYLRKARTARGRRSIEPIDRVAGAAAYYHDGKRMELGRAGMGVGLNRLPWNTAPSLGSVYSHQLPSLLLIVKFAFFGEAGKFVHRHPEGRLLSPMQVLRDRMDPVAVDVVGDVRYFEGS